MLPLCNNTVGINNNPQVVPSPAGQSSLPLPTCTLSPGSKESCSALGSFAQTSPDFCRPWGTAHFCWLAENHREGRWSIS